MEISKSGLKLLDKVLIGIDLVGRSIETVNDLLDLDGVAVCVLNLRGVSKGNVFETVDLTKAPEHLVAILTSTLNLEHFAEVKLLKSSQSKVINHLTLGEWLSGVHAQIVGNIVTGVVVLEGLEEAELAN